MFATEEEIRIKRKSFENTIDTAPKRIVKTTEIKREGKLKDEKNIYTKSNEGILKRVLEIKRTILGKNVIIFRYQKWKGNIESFNKRDKVKPKFEPTIKNNKREKAEIVWIMKKVKSWEKLFLKREKDMPIKTKVLISNIAQKM